MAAGEVGRLWRRRVVVEEPETTPEVLQKGARAALDTVEAARLATSRQAPWRPSSSTCSRDSFFRRASSGLTAFGKRRGLRPFFDVVVGRTHIHHFVPGIAIAFGSGTVALFTRDDRLRETLAIPLGVGMGLTLDESALLILLEDVYWTRRGLVGVQITLGTASLLAASIIALRILRRGERSLEEQDELPPAPGVRDPFTG